MWDILFCTWHLSCVFLHFTFIFCNLHFFAIYIRLQFTFVCISLQLTISTAMKFASKFLRKWSFWDQNQQPLTSVEPFERILRAFITSQCPYKFSFFLDFRNAFNRFQLFSRDFRRLQFIFLRYDCFSKWPHPPKCSKLSTILWKNWNFWKRISANQIHSGGEVGWYLFYIFLYFFKIQYSQLCTSTFMFLEVQMSLLLAQN